VGYIGNLHISAHMPYISTHMPYISTYVTYIYATATARRDRGMSEHGHLPPMSLLYYFTTLLLCYLTTLLLYYFATTERWGIGRSEHGLLPLVNGTCSRLEIRCSLCTYTHTRIHTYLLASYPANGTRSNLEIRCSLCTYTHTRMHTYMQTYLLP
jgi:hypothetical protein